jgi:hypothetical protein
MNPTVKINGVVNLKLPPYRVAIHENILIPVGTAMIIVAAVKYALVSTSKPILNIWWLHTKKPSIPIENIA